MTIVSPRPRVVALVPCYNDATSIELTVESLLKEEIIDRVVVIDDGSTDGSGAIARLAGATVLSLRTNHGKAAAIELGMRAARQADVYLLVDADTRRSARAVVALAEPILRDDADLVIGRLPRAGSRGGFGLVSRVARWGIQLGSGVDCQAPLSGQRAIRGTLLRSLSFSQRFGIEVSMTIDAARANARIVEMEVNMDHHHHGRTMGGFLHRGQQGLDVARALWSRVPSMSYRIALLAVATIVVLGALLVRAQNNVELVESSDLPRVENPRIVVSPYWSYDDVHLGRTGVINDAGLASLGIPAHRAQSWAVGSVASGKLDNVVDVIARGSRDPHAPRIDGIDVTTERVPQTAEEVRASLRLGAGSDRPTFYVGVDGDKGDLRLRPVILTGIGEHGGLLVSASTHRQGLVDVTDIAPTVLAMAGREIPTSVTGSVLTYIPGAASHEKLSEADKTVRAFDRITPAFIWIFSLLLAFTYFVAWARWRDGRQLMYGNDIAALFIAATPLATYLVRQILGLGSLSATGWIGTFAVCVAGVVVVSRLGARDSTTSLRRILFWTVLGFWVDAAVGTPLQFVGVFGSNPALGARYYGFGNPATSLLLSATFLWAALHVDMAYRRQTHVDSAQRSVTMAWFRALAICIITLVVVGTPGLGSDVGGLVVGAFVLSGYAVALRAGRVKKRFLALAGVSAVVVVGVIGALDVRRSPQSRTHLGRSLASISENGFGPAWETVARKADANLFSYGFPWNFIVIGVALLLLWALRKGKWSGILPIGSPIRAGVVATFLVGLIGFVLNDSGVVIIAMIVIYVGPCVLLQYRSLRHTYQDLEVHAS